MVVRFLLFVHIGMYFSFSSSTTRRPILVLWLRKEKKEFPKQVGTGQTVAQSTSLLVNPSWLSSTTSKTAAATLRAII